ncbi:hypothetical protein ACWCXB_30090 [Streptomyces sp. NPDC001514]
MAVSAAGRVGRFYTAARRHPWVLGKVADWRIPLGPYTPAQIALAVGGGFVLVKTVSLWSWMGPVPIVAWLLAIWVVRRPKIAGRAPLQAGIGWLLLAWQPRGGRIGGRAARDLGAHPLGGGFVIEDAAPGPAMPEVLAAGAKESRMASGIAARAARGGGVSRLPGRRRPAVVDVPRPSDLVPVSGVQRLRELSVQSGGGR